MSPEIPTFAPLNSEPGALGRVTRADVIAEARSWLDSPFVHQHREKGHGVDCAGLVIGVARELGIVARDFDITGYARTPDGKSLIAQCDRFMTRVPMHAMLPGHVLVIRFELDPAHLAIVGDYMHGGLSLIHAFGTTDGRGKVVEWRLEANRKGWKPLQAYALPGVV